MIAVDTINTPLGTLAAAWGPAGLLLLEFEDRFPWERNRHRLQHRFPDWDGRPKGPVPTILAAQLSAYFAGERDRFELPLDRGGTRFQQRVWNALAGIPAGMTRSYDGLARQIGAPGAQRAVARANGQNPLSIVVPCHRVIGADGGLRGYGGGVWRKAWLLAHERRTWGPGTALSLSPLPAQASR